MLSCMPHRFRPQTCHFLATNWRAVVRIGERSALKPTALSNSNMPAKEPGGRGSLPGIIEALVHALRDCPSAAPRSSITGRA